MAGLPKPLCAQCGREVEETSTSFSPVTRKWTVTVLCHGETETTFLSEKEYEQAKITQGVAFKGEGDR
jgi:hypothetical protein